ncbi:hypothetical protein BLA29_007148, partial [Euroglyphus maynei]
MKNPKSKRILVAPIKGIGHVNACIGVTKGLLNRGHRVAFFLETPFSGKLKSYGFEEFLYEPYKDEDENVEQFKNPGEQMANKLLETGILGKNDLRTQLTRLGNRSKIFQHERIKYEDEQLRLVIEKFQPDLFIIDNITLEPAIYYSNKPWIDVMSVVPLLYLQDIDTVPPAWTGFSNNDNNHDEWNEYRKYTEMYRYSKEFNDFIEQIGYKRYPDDIMLPKTQSLTIYAHPEEYDYPEIKQYHPDWFNIDVFNKNEKREMIDLKEFLPKEFYESDLDGKFSGKFIYVSMGSMGSIDLDLMK